MTISGVRNPVFATVPRTFRTQFRSTSNAQSMIYIADITGPSLVKVQLQDSVQTFVKMNTINGWREI